MKKIICSPGSYIQGSGELRCMAEYYGQLGTRGVYLIVDSFILKNYRADIESSFKAENIPFEIGTFGGECSMKEIELHRSRLGTCDVVIGIGGGKTLDASKAVSFYAHLPVIIVPTAASTDAPCSRLSVVYRESGEFDRYLPLPKNPDMVIMDLEVIAKAPVRFLMAGVGDALATYYEAAAAVKKGAVTMTGGHSTKAAMTLAKLCRDTLLEDALKAKAAAELGVVTKALENIVEANTFLSGIGFESCGLAAAHAVHDGLTVLEETHSLLHGEKVAFGTITQLILENYPGKEVEEIIRFCRKCGLPTTLADLNLSEAGDERLLEAAAASCVPDDTMGNMPFEVKPEDVLAAMKTADAMAKTLEA